NWALAVSSGSVTEKQTDFSAETFTFKFTNVSVNPTGTHNNFHYEGDSKAGILVTPGFAFADKKASDIELSPLKSITKIEFVHAATGGNRGYKILKKDADDTNWVELYALPANPANGQLVSVPVNGEDVAIKIQNRDPAQNAYLLSLKIFGNYTATGTQYALTTSVNTTNAGTITKSPNSSVYSAGTVVNLNATANFGFKFVKWVDASNGDATLSTLNPYDVTIDAVKDIKAVFEAVTTYSFNLQKAGSTWGEIQVTPAPVGGKYEAGTEVFLKVIPNPVTNFNYWEDSSTNTERSVLVNSDKTITATFDEIPFIVGWSFNDQNTRQNKVGDYYSETTNTGSISVHEPTGVKVNWQASSTGYTPSLPNLRLWTSAASFNSGTPRYLQAELATTGYKNIRVKALVAGNYQGYAVYKLQYSLDNATFSDVSGATANIKSATHPAPVYKNEWTELSGTLPVDAEGQSRVYLRWVADLSSEKLDTNTGAPNTDVEGTAFTNVYIYADKEIVNDNDAPALIAVIPADASNTATINGSIVLTFNERVKSGSGNSMLGASLLTGVYGTKTATFPYEKLAYNTNYTFTVPAGAITDMSGNPYPGLTVSFKTAQRIEPVKKVFDAVVATDGSGDYTSVIAAISAAPSNRQLPWVIFIKNGIYTGHHEIPQTKPFIHLIGQSRDGVIIKDNLTADNGAVAVRSTMVVQSTDCYFENFIIENSHGYLQQTGPMAEALYTNNDKFAMKNVYLRSFQDTYLTSGRNMTDRHYILGSRIEGSVDFIYGSGDVFFDKDTLTITRAGSY
ncbi:MAG: hypothetical protein EOO92_17125, partial [Pedobacter sp.]